MELKRLLDRANVLLLQGEYQGAESFIEQAMAEANKLKQELAELDTLRTRVTEMAAEVEYLQSVIDEANAQEPAIVVKGRKVVGFNPAEGTRIEGEFYTRPIPSQQSAYFLTEYIAPSGSVDPKNFGAIPDAQQSPAVVVPDGWKLVPMVLTDEMVEAFNIAEDSFQDGRGTAPDCHWAAMISAAPLPHSGQSPRITEQDAHPGVSYPSGKGVLVVPDPDVNGVVIVRDECGEYRRVADTVIVKLNGDKND